MVFKLENLKLHRGSKYKNSGCHSNTTAVSAGSTVLAKIRVDQSTKTSEQTILAPSSMSFSNDLWEEAFQSLSPGERQHLSAVLEHGGEGADPTTKQMKFPHKGAEVLIAIAEKKQDQWKSRRWKFNIGGHEIEPRTYTERIVSCLGTAGDIGAQLLPSPASIIWPLIKTLMQIPVHANEDIGAALMTAEVVVRHISCGHSYEKIYLEKIKGELKESLKSALVKLYAASLKLLSCALKQLNTPTAKRLLLAFLDPEKTQGQVTGLENSYSDLIKVIQICQNQVNVDIDDRTIAFLDKFHDIDSFLQKSFGKLFEQMDEESLSKILDWISPVKEYDQHGNSKKARARETCEWILKKQEFQDWEQSMSPALIWLQGTMGTGKTVLTSKVIDYLLDKPQRPQDRVVYYYCRRVNEYEDPENVIRSLFRQLAKPTPNSNQIRRDVQALFKQMRDHTSQLPIETCRDQLLKSLKQYDQITFVIDGLDECKKETIDTLLETIEFLLADKEHPTRVFLSSRPDGYIKESFSRWPSIRTGTSDSGISQDIARFIDVEVGKFACKRSSEYTKYEKAIKGRLLEKSNGMFQWVYLQTARLKGRRLPEDVLKGIEKMPVELPKAYENIYQLISEGESQKALVDRAFMWILCSCAPLTSEILLAGVCLSGDSDTAHSKITEDDMLDFGQNLIVLDESQGLWRFSHASVAEFVEKKRDLWSSQQAHSYAGRVCLRYMMASYGRPFGDEDLDIGRKVKVIIPRSISKSDETGSVFRFPDDDKFLHYCRHHWIFHVKHHKWTVQRPEMRDPLMALLNAFLDSKAQNTSAYSRWLQHSHIDLKGLEGWWADSTSMFYLRNMNYLKIWDLHPSSLPVLAICRFGLDAIFAEWWDNGKISPLQTNENGENLLELASKARSSFICKRLVECRPTHYRGRARGALEISAKHGSCDILNIFLKNSIALELSKSDHGNALEIAASNGRIEIVRALLGDEGPFDLTEYYETTLAATAYHGQIEAMQFLIDKGALVNLPLRGRYESALAAAASNGQLNAVEFLIDMGAAVDLPLKGRYGSALAAAACNDRLLVVRFLIDKGAFVDLSLQGRYGSSLAAAASNGLHGAVKFLVNNGATIDLPLEGRYHGSALAAAALNGQLWAVKCLIDEGANIDLPLQGCHGSALAAVSSNGMLDAIQFLVDEGATIDLSLKTGNYGSALAAAASNGQLEAVQFLVNKGAMVDLSLQTGVYGSAIEAAAGMGRIDVVKFLAERGASFDLPLQTGYFGSALAAAAFTERLDVIQFLVEKGASIDLLLQTGHFGSALAVAAVVGKLETVHFLVNQGATIDLLLETGDYGSALAAAAAGGRIEIVNYMIQKGNANVNLALRAGKYRSALHAASDKGNAKCVEALLAARAIQNPAPQSSGPGAKGMKIMKMEVPPCGSGVRKEAT
ncbi:ankyrin [Penicillium malachiteum]|uniref:Ankyrin n=1 Tax=Penicillium malachiteum TaxID=1324776 RepID=A0AAD6HEZ9_9EURO|nr:ankyrin [Penicillium malachiteum]